MTVPVVKIDPDHPQLVFARCREIIASGGVIAYPTDTFYGLGVDPNNPLAVKRLFELKNRPQDQPVLLLIADTEDVRQWAADVPDAAHKLMKRFWPGPLTLVFGAKHAVLTELTAGSGTIGLRVPGNDMVRALLRYIGHGLTGTSANRSGLPSCRTALAVAHAIGDRVDLIVEGGWPAGERPSTVVDARSNIIRVLREGTIPASDILL